MVRVKFLSLDAGQMREFLAKELAEWRAAGYKSADYVQTFHRRVRILARKSNRTREEVWNDIKADAEIIAQGQ